MIKEGLTLISPLNTAISVLTKKWGNSGFKFDGGSGFGIKVVPPKSTNEITLKSVLKWVNNLGYFPSLYNINGQTHKYDSKEFMSLIKQEDVSYIFLRKKYDDPIREWFIPRKAYHASPTKNEEKILRIGLSPRSGKRSSNFPDRIYMTIDEESLGEMIEDSDFGSEPMTIFEIDLGRLKPTKSIKFYNDPELPLDSAFYTMDNIPPQYIKVVKRTNPMFSQ